MGLFSRKPEPTPIRRDEVRKLFKLVMDEVDAADRDIESAAFDRAKAAYDRQLRRVTPAELDAVNEARRRHGY